MSEAYYAALEKCADRYHDMVSDIISWDASAKNFKLLDFIIELHRESKARKMPLMKLNRWLGYIQGCLIERGETTVEVERDWTRPLFRPLDFGTDNMKIATTIHMTDADVRNVISRHLSDKLGHVVPVHAVRFATSRGDNGEMGGKPTPDRVEVHVSLER